jgi:endonuclease/exonuclease/phosphatase family metal-dependent hydrolase
MTYNLRYASELDVHPWSQRRSLMIDLLTESAPAVLGTQEGLRHQLDEITDGLPSRYAWVGNGRGQPDSDEYCAIFFDNERFRVLDMTQRWFSTTPEVPGSLSWGACPRIMTAVTLQERRNGDELIVINTHLDHMSVYARRFSADYLVDYVLAMSAGRPTIVMGDFNTASRVSAVYRRLAETPLTDTFEIGGGQDRPTFNNYLTPPVVGHRIDWLLVSAGIAVENCQVSTRNFDGQFPSDHLPVEATVRVPRPLQKIGAVSRHGSIARPAWVAPAVE